MDPSDGFAVLHSKASENVCIVAKTAVLAAKINTDFQQEI